jgi:REP element-mobilizing transposase RayT
LFGEITDGLMVCNDAGTMVENEWLKLPTRFTNIQLHEYIVMPNHFHAILEIVWATLDVAPVRVSLVDTPNEPDTPNEKVAQNNDFPNDGIPIETVAQKDDDSPIGQPQGIAPTGITVGEMVGAFQSIVTVEYIRGVKTMGWTRFNGKLWQRNYYEHIIRNERSYQIISNYIINNPAKWKGDKFNMQ